MSKWIPITSFFFLSLSAASAGDLAYWKLDGNGNDSSGHQRTLEIDKQAGKQPFVSSPSINGRALGLVPSAGGLFGRCKKGGGLYLNSGTFTIQIWVNFGNLAAREQVLIENGPAHQTKKGWWGKIEWVGNTLSLKGGTTKPTFHDPLWTLTKLYDDKHKHRIRFDYGSIGTTTDTVNLEANKWYHIVAVRREVSPGKHDTFIHINGTSEQAAERDRGAYPSGQIPTTVSAAEEHFLMIGIGRRRNPDKYMYHLTGYVDEVRIWSRGLSDTEIKSEYARFASGH